MIERDLIERDPTLADLLRACIHVGARTGLSRSARLRLLLPDVEAARRLGYKLEVILATLQHGGVRFSSQAVFANDLYRARLKAKRNGNPAPDDLALAPAAAEHRDVQPQQPSEPAKLSHAQQLKLLKQRHYHDYSSAAHGLSFDQIQSDQDQEKS
jgi:hypothetical protein